MKPPKHVEVSFEMLFPLLVYYFAQLRESGVGGEWSTDLSWEKVCNGLDLQGKIKLTRSQLESLLYSYKMGVMDRRRPFKILNYYAKNYTPLMQRFKIYFPDLFKEAKDGEILMIGKDYEPLR